MRGLRQLTWTAFKLYLREPIATGFTLVFPPMLVLLFGTMYGNDPVPVLGGRGTMDISMPAYTGLILGTIGLLNVPITTATYREQGILRRLRATPLRPLTYLTSDVLNNLVMTGLGMAVLVAVGKVLYDVRFEGQLIGMLAAVVLSALAMFAFGYLIASLAPGARLAQVIGMVIFYPMMFLSGAAMPIEIMPESIQRISTYLPLTYVVRLLKAAWFGEPLRDHLLEVAILGAILLVSGGLAARLFRWD
jgi:ABC-2 type transport system permease protein